MQGAEMLLAGAILFLAYLVRGVSGFGSALVAVPLLAHAWPLTLVVPTVAVLDLFAALLLTGVGQRQRHVAWREVAWLVPGSMIGIAIGLHLLLALDRAVLLAALGLVVLGFGVRYLLGLDAARPISRGWALPAGIAGGGIGAVFSTGGPPYVVYLAHRLRDKGALRATLSAVFLIDGGLRVAGLLMAGLLMQGGMAVYLLGGLPLVAAGLYAGNHVHLGLTPRQMTVAVALLLIASGLSLWWRVIATG